MRRIPSWELSKTQYTSVLESLVKRGLATKLDSGKVSTTLGGGVAKMNASRRFTPDYDITAAGREALRHL